jgi:hypothetical protein
MRKFFAFGVLAMCLIGSAHAAPSAVEGGQAAADAAVARSLGFDGQLIGIGHGNTVRVVIQCTVKARGRVVVVTQVLACSVTSSGGGTVKGVTPVTFAGPIATTFGFGTLHPGTDRMCITGHATYGFPAGGVTTTRCFDLVPQI